MPRHMMRNSSLIPFEYLTNRTPNDPCIATTSPIPSWHFTHISYTLINTPPLPPSLSPSISWSNIRIQTHTLHRYILLIPFTTLIASPPSPPSPSTSSSPSPGPSLIQHPFLRDDTTLTFTPTRTKIRIRLNIKIHSLYPPDPPIHQPNFNPPRMIPPREYLAHNTTNGAAGGLVFF
ncbi:hypothetical protein AbraIFM66951_004926 [Aspergillus brasiliensis]|uniref:Uncharacterized protein n=1 Tax=Aspergillus brasiliensis TaxID=319629 RepID=A0A9W6DTF3_9EURO|nr:hypothetical protein AbraCBS73388_002507 [Aspergillus brasiliensis]GKZ43560.1 hypothetical protein AbraIFM66951_004926 [Aspergillus brasiliensis]